MHTTFQHCHAADRQATTWVQTRHLLSACPELKVWQEMLSTLRGCIRVLRSTVPIVRSFLTFWSFWQGTHSHSLRKHSPCGEKSSPQEAQHGSLAFSGLQELPSEQDLQANYLMVAGDQILNTSPWDCYTTKTLFSCFLLHHCEVFQTATRNINSQKPSWGIHSSFKELWQTANPGKSQAQKSFIKLEAKNGGTRVILFNVSALQRSSFKCRNNIIFWKSC